MAVYSQSPVPVPTPFKDIQYGGNPYISSNVLGQSVSSQDRPIYGPTQSGAVMFSNGALVPSQSVSAAPRTQPLAPITNQTITAPVTQSQPTNSGNQQSDLDRLVDEMMNRGGYTNRDAARGVAQANFGSLFNEYFGNNQAEQARIQAELDNGYNSYFAQLDDVMNNYLPSQRTAMEGMAQSQFNTGLGDIDAQRTQGMDLIANQRQQVMQNQDKNLKSLSANLRNSFMAGNVLLGSRGAGDSSAANQYSYALTKLGNQQRGDVMNQTANILNEIGGREKALNDTYSNEKNRLQQAYNQSIQSVAQWFAGQQQNIALQKGAAQKERSQQALQIALQELQRIQSDQSNRQNMLDQWALNNSKSLEEMRSKYAAVQGYNPQMPQVTPLVSAPVTDASGGLTQAKYGGGYTDEQKAPVGYGSIFSTPTTDSYAQALISNYNLFNK